MDSIIFDVDGTLWDSTEIVAEAWNDYLTNTEHMDTDVSSRRLMGLFGQLLPDIAKALFPKLPESEQLRIIDGCCQAEHEALLRKCAPLYPQLEETLKNLSARFPAFYCQQLSGRIYRSISAGNRIRPLLQRSSLPW